MLGAPAGRFHGDTGGGRAAIRLREGSPPAVRRLAPLSSQQQQPHDDARRRREEQDRNVQAVSIRRRSAHCHDATPQGSDYRGTAHLRRHQRIVRGGEHRRGFVGGAAQGRSVGAQTTSLRGRGVGQWHGGGQAENCLRGRRYVGGPVSHAIRRLPSVPFVQYKGFEYGRQWMFGAFATAVGWFGRFERTTEATIESPWQQLHRDV
mmetsp:Transcript_16952/g.40579  ORF Transcript_16952/g.40579 Transcript_16952/m.40579 type:complete len:206 (-) Transcript_16952:1634-2251(-)